MQRQQAAFDRLGPLAREAVNNSPLDVNTELLVAKYDRPMVFAGKLRPVPLDDPARDAQIAKAVKDKVIEKFGVEPDTLVLRSRRGELRRARLSRP